MMLLYVCNGLARPVDESMLTRDIATTGQTTGIARGGIKSRPVSSMTINYLTYSLLSFSFGVAQAPFACQR